MQGAVVHAYRSATRRRPQRDHTTLSRPDEWSSQKVLGQPELHGESVSRKPNENEKGRESTQGLKKKGWGSHQGAVPGDGV